MRTILAPRTTRALSVALSYLCVVAGLLPAVPAPARAAARRAEPAQAADTHFVRKLSLNAKDLVFDPNTQTLYASVPSAAGAGGNSVTPINPVAGTVGTPVFVGSEPGKMAVSDDRQYIYVSLDGAAAVRRFDVATQTAGPQFSLGFGTFASDGPLYARDLAVQPGSPSTLAVFRGGSFSSSSVAVYDDGVARGSTVSAFDTLSLAFSASTPTRLYAFGGGSLRRLTVAAGGVTQVNTTNVSGFGSIKFDNGRLYVSSGQVLDPESGGLLGTFSAPNIQGANPFATDSQKGRTYFLTAPFSSPGSPTTFTLRAFDQQTFTPAGTLDIPGVLGSPTALVRWGANGLAFSTTAGELYLIQTTLVPSDEPVPTPTPTPSTTPTPAPTPTPQPAFAREVALLANDIVYDPSTQKIYASVPSSAGAGGNSVTPVATSDGTLGTPVFVGSEPGKMAISDTGQRIYVSLDGAAAVRRFDTDTQTAGLQFNLGAGQFGSSGQLFVEDMEVMPSSPGTVAVSRRNVGFSPRHEGVAIYDDGVRRPTTTPGHTGANLIEFASADTLYGLNIETTEFGFRTMKVTADGVTVTKVTQGVFSGFGGSIEYNNGRIYLGGGRVIDAETGAILGTFQGVDGSQLAVPDSSTGRTFFVGPGSSFGPTTSTVTIRAFDQQTFLPLGTAQVANVRGGVRSAVRWGANGIAFCTTGGQVFLVQTPLVSASEPSPEPTPTASPTPTPTPTPAPTPGPGELRQISQAANDLVVDPNTQKIYASVPSSAGAGGNSLAPIDPAAGTVGTPVFVGSEPTKLAISDNGQYIYVGLDGAAAVRRFDVATQTAAEPQFSLAADGFFGPSRVEDMEVAPGQPGVVAISLKRSGSPRHGGVAIYDNGVKRPTMTPDHTGSNVIEFSNSPAVLYGQNTETSEFGFRRMGVAACGVVTVRTIPNLFSGGFGNDFRVANNIAYATSGRAADPEAGAQVGLFSLFSSSTSFPSTPTLVVPEPKAGKVYFLVNDNGFRLRVYDIRTFLKVGELRLAGVTGTPASLVRWGANGLAFRNGAGLVYLLQNSLIGGTDPTYSPAPAPTAPTFSAAGRVSVFNATPNGSPVPDVTLSVTGSLTTTATTDASGNYSLSGIPICGSFTVTPSKANYVFSPASVTISNPANTAGQLNFSATLKTVGFTTAATNASEFSGLAFINVTRNVTTDAATVSYETVSGTASDRADFNTTLGTLRFAPGEGLKTIIVMITDDALVEGPESFTVTLKDPSGAALVEGASTITVDVNDNDATQTNINPLSDARFFVAQHYRDFLNRNASDDPSGYDFWTNQILECQSQTNLLARENCLEDHRINVSAAFFLSIEFQQTGFLVHRLYTASYPDTAARPKGLPRFREFLSDTQEIGRGVVVNVGNWQQQLEANKQAFALSFVQRPEFVAAQPEGLPAGEFVDRLFANAGATPTAEERGAAVAAFGAGGASGRAAALRSVAESKSVSDRQFNSGFVLMQYFGYLRRGPNEPPDADFSGYQFWLDKLNTFGDFRRAEMVKAFLVSLEYQDRFGLRTFDIRK
ncbi:MAG TPA: Calx-beta domain-containing protein [Pyrinomonadaceae bacterium]|nr:Calx-beta domain-containing protein [Pyrinomonadaceae bacterium]